MILSMLAAAAMLLSPPAKDIFESELIFPPQAQHNHGSCIVELPNGDLLTAWYRGSGERQADDVAILGSRKKKGSAKWSEPFVMADTPGFPDCNAAMIVDAEKRLWLVFPTILDNHWESALTQFRVSRNYLGTGCPKWEDSGTLFLKPGPEFQAAVDRDLEKQWAPYGENAPADRKELLKQYLVKWKERAANKLTVRLGWMPRAHPFLSGKRLILPLYSDGFDFSLMAFTDDGGKTWKTSEPLVGAGNVQPSIVKRKDGTLVAYFRDNGPPLQRVMVSESKDNGQTWSLSRDINLPNPGSGLEAIVLKSGRWLLVCNPTEQGRDSLGIYISEDEGRTWPRLTHLEDDIATGGKGSYSYPSIIQAKDGTIHVTYSYKPNIYHVNDEGKGETIKHFRFGEDTLFWPVRP